MEEVERKFDEARLSLRGAISARIRVQFCYTIYAIPCVHKERVYFCHVPVHNLHCSRETSRTCVASATRNLEIAVARELEFSRESSSCARVRRLCSLANRILIARLCWPTKAAVSSRNSSRSPSGRLPSAEGRPRDSRPAPTAARAHKFPDQRTPENTPAPSPLLSDFCFVPISARARACANEIEDQRLIVQRRATPSPRFPSTPRIPRGNSTSGENIPNSLLGGSARAFARGLRRIPLN